jgi:hypothetical protein
MTKDLALSNQENSLDEWGDREEIGSIAKRLKAMLPNGENLTDQQAYAAAQYAKLSGLDPFASGFFAMPGGGITQHYAILVNWAQQKSPYSDRYLPLSDDEREVEGIEESAIAWKCYVLKNSDAPTLAVYMQAGMPFTDALDFCAAKGIGFVTDKDRTNKYGKPIDPPKNWTWQKVAQKRALRSALALSHGRPSVDELRRIAQQVTPEGRLERLETQYTEIARQSEELTPEEHKRRRDENARLLHGEPAGGDWLDGEVVDSTVADWDKFCDRVLDNIKFFQSGDEVKAAISSLELEYSADNEDVTFDALAKYANKKADEKEQAELPK